MDADTVALIADVATALAAVTGVGVAVLGLDAWELQLHGRSNYELARRILRTTYRVRDKIANVRLPVTTPDEIPQALEEAGIDPEPDPEPGPGFHGRIAEVVYQRRWKRMSEAWSDLEVEEREAEVLWGRDFSEVFDPLDSCVGELSVAIAKHLRDQSEDADDVRYAPLSPQERREVEAVYKRPDFPSEQDEFREQVDNAVRHIEERVRPHLEVRRSLLGRLRKMLS